MTKILKSHNKNINIFYWLSILTIMTFFMILIGGLTRLTESGLSMVDWRPIMGFLPPLNLNEWIVVFENYKKTPEFKIVNYSMELSDFKYIFWWEWFHRFFARCIGLVFIVPFIFFFFTKQISKKLYTSLFILFLFGLIQAIVGWWMVKSGLNQNPYVSNYRLAFHLTNAVIIFSILFWLSINSFYLINLNFLPKTKLEFIFFLIISFLFITIVSGAFMAGSHAGQSFNTYPLMNGYIFPDDYFLEDFGLKNLFENTVAINFNHRWLSTFTFVFILTVIIYMFISNKFKNYNTKILLIFFFAILQFFLGILTLLTNVKIYYASLHQINSMLLLSTILIMYYAIKKERFLK